MADALPTTLQEAVLAALCFDDKLGAIVAAQVKPGHFDDPYRPLAVSALAYRKRYNRAPGRTQLNDMLTISTRGGADNDSHARRILNRVTAEAEGLNFEYVANRVSDFIREQTLQAALIEAGERFSRGGDGMVAEVEQLLHKALNFRGQTLDAGVFLNDPRALSFLDQADIPFISLGIPVLDELQIGPTPKEMILYIAPKGSGKTHFCVHVGRSTVAVRKRALHVSLEMSEERVAQRYMQNIFGVAKRREKILRVLFDYDELDRLDGFRIKHIEPRLTLRDKDIKKILRNKVKPWGTRLGKLVIKAFPTGALTVDQLDAYLEYLSSSEGFVPDVVVVDYPELMSLKGELRHAIGANIIGLRGIAVSRNLAMVCPSQGGRAAINARQVTSTMVAEDVRKVDTADVVLTYSRTKAEERLNLGRLRVEHARNEEGGRTVLLSQSYATSQYVVRSAELQQAYWERLKEVTGEGGEDEED